MVSIICNISPSANNFFQTVSTLRFANRAKNIKLKPAINERIINKYNERKQIINENKEIVVEKNGNIGYNIYNNNIYNILNQSESELNDSENISGTNYEMKYYEILLKNKKLISENNKLKDTIENLMEINNNEDNFINAGIEKIKNLMAKYNINDEMNQFIGNNLKEIKMNYINQIKAIQSENLSKLNEIQNLITQNINNNNNSTQNDQEEKNKELFSEINLDFDEAKKINEVKLIYEKKEKELEQLMQQYRENIDYYFETLINKNNDKSSEKLISQEHKQKISELEALYEKKQNILENNFFKRLKELMKKFI